MKVENLYLHNLRNDAHFQFFTEFRALVERYGAATLKIQPQYQSLVALYNDADTALKKIMKSALTADIHDADKYRDDIWRGMVDANLSALHHYDEAVRKAATKLKIVFDTYGNLAQKPLDEETSGLYNILKDLDEKYADERTTVGLDGWITELRTANQAFEGLMMNRYDESAARTDLVLKNVRVEIDAVYHAIVERINAAIIIEGATAYTDFVTTLNTIIKRNSDILAQRKGAAAAAKGRRNLNAEIDAFTKEA
jgi:hypothetical protein